MAAEVEAGGVRISLVLDAGLGVGHAANVAACIAAGLAGGWPGLAGQPLRDANGLATASSCRYPVTVLRGDATVFTRLLEQLPGAPNEARAVLFPGYARQLHDASRYWSEHEQRDHRHEPLLGIGLVGPKAWIRQLTGALPLLK